MNATPLRWGRVVPPRPIRRESGSKIASGVGHCIVRRTVGSATELKRGFGLLMGCVSLESPLSFLVEIAAVDIVDDDCWKVLNRQAPDRFGAEILIVD